MKAAIYCRLSKEDEEQEKKDREKESESIQNQKSMLITRLKNDTIFTTFIRMRIIPVSTEIDRILTG